MGQSRRGDEPSEFQSCFGGGLCCFKSQLGGWVILMLVIKRDSHASYCAARDSDSNVTLSTFQGYIWCISHIKFTKR